jgi:hypothetical protein
VAEAIERLDGCIVGLAQMKDDVADDLTGRQLVETDSAIGRSGVRPSSLRSATSMLSRVCAGTTSPSRVRRSISSPAIAAMACHPAGSIRCEAGRGSMRGQGCEPPRR